MNYFGITLGVCVYLVIAVWHFLVIKGEYYLGKTVCTVLFVVLAVLCIVLSLLVRSPFLSAVIAIFGFSALWGIREVFQQERRVQRGWFPKRDKKS